MFRQASKENERAIAGRVIGAHVGIAIALLFDDPFDKILAVITFNSGITRLTC